MNDTARNHSASDAQQSDLFGVCDVRGGDLSGKSDHLSDAQRAGPEDVGEGLLGVRGSASDESGRARSAAADHVEPIACARCESNSHIYEARACCQARLRADQMVHALRLYAGNVLRAHGLASRQELIRKFVALHGVARGEELKALVSSLWSERG